MNKEENNVGGFIGTAFVPFIATNLDDLVVLMNFFTEASMTNSSLKVRDVFIGQYLGFLVILGISLIGYGISYAVPVEILGFLGFLPIILGIKGVIEIIIGECKKCNINIDDRIANDNTSINEVETVCVPNDVDGEILSALIIDEEQQNFITNSPSTIKSKQKIFKLLSYYFNPQTLQVASITLANSGDNIAIYTPLFSQASKWEIGIYISIFLVMVFIWLIFSYYFINFRPILNIAQKCANYIVPIIFIGLGIYIIITSDCFPWLARAIRTKNFKNG